MKFECHFWWQTQVGGVHVTLCVAAAAFGAVYISFFVVGVAYAEIWDDSWSGKRCNF